MKKTFFINGENVISDVSHSLNGLVVELNGALYGYRLLRHADGSASLQGNGKNMPVYVGSNAVFLNGIEVRIEESGKSRKRQTAGNKDAAHTAPMPGMVLKVHVAVGDEVEAGQALLVMEAMKLQHTIKAAHSGTVRAVHCEKGKIAEPGKILIEIEDTEHA